MQGGPRATIQGRAAFGSVALSAVQTTGHDTGRYAYQEPQSSINAIKPERHSDCGGGHTMTEIPSQRLQDEPMREFSKKVDDKSGCLPQDIQTLIFKASTAYVPREKSNRPDRIRKRSSHDIKACHVYGQVL